ncbi:RidA family protein [Ruania zhangjianzhongii]|uniref:RidA family protein n=1 Tax=Ruania zhangjianzhongii TaxID=2603206 RepID=UPI0011CC73B6|nr:Rid family hydrolase [Ruania zhangjianzhongii]
MKHGIVSTDLPAPAGAYSHVVECGGIVFTAGFGPQDPVTGAVAEGVEAQTRQVVLNVQGSLEKVGLGLSDVVKTTVHLAHLDRDTKLFNAVYAEMFEEPYPARTTVGSTLAGILVEIDAVAIRSS